MNFGKKTWALSFEEDLISLVRKDGFLYNSKCKSHSTLLKRSARWNAIAKELNRPAKECKKRWRSLRDRYVRERRKMEQPSESDSTETQKWVLFDSLEFLNSSLQPSKPHIKSSKQLRNFSEIDMDASSSTQETTSSPMEETFIKFLEDMSTKINATIAEPPPEKLNYNQKFMAIMALRMEPLSEPAKIRIQTLVLNSINEELLKKLKS